MNPLLGLPPQGRKWRLRHVLRATIVIIALTAGIAAILFGLLMVIGTGLAG